MCLQKYDKDFTNTNIKMQKKLEDLSIEERKAILKETFDIARKKGKAYTPKELAVILDTSTGQMSRAMAGDERNLSPNLIRKALELLDEWKKEDADNPEGESLPVLPMEAVGGTLSDFSLQASDYDCERMISPVKGADFAIKVYGESMAPEYPSGCTVLIKKINENAFVEWGKVYVLDTVNGVVVKKIEPGKKEGEVECLSLNPAYHPFAVPCGYIIGWYRVLAVLAMK